MAEPWHNILKPLGRRAAMVDGRLACRCGHPRWADMRFCYSCAKQEANLFGWPSTPDSLKHSEQLLVGILPKFEPSRRSVDADRILRAASRRDDVEAARLAEAKARGIRWLIDLPGVEERIEGTT